MMRPDAIVFLADLFREFRFLFHADETAHHWHGAAGIQHVHDWFMIMRRNLHRRVRFAGGRAADEQRGLEALTLHLFGDVRHFVQ